MGEVKARKGTDDNPASPFVEVKDLIRDGEWIELMLDIGDATVILCFQEEGFRLFREAVNKEPHDVNAP